MVDSSDKHSDITWTNRVSGKVQGIQGCPRLSKGSLAIAGLKLALPITFRAHKAYNTSTWLNSDVWVSYQWPFYFWSQWPIYVWLKQIHKASRILLSQKPWNRVIFSWHHKKFFAAISNISVLVPATLLSEIFSENKTTTTLFYNNNVLIMAW